MKTVVIRLTPVLAAFLIGVLFPYLIEFTIKFKNQQVRVPRRIYSQPKASEKWGTIFILAISFYIAFSYFELFEAFFLSVCALLAVFGSLIDRRIRIIPNELVILMGAMGVFYQWIFYGPKGLLSGLMAMIAVGLLFTLSGVVTKMISGQLGVGAGDIKLSMVLAFMLGYSRLYLFMIGIAAAILFYVTLGILRGTVQKGSKFPMGVQIMGGYIIALYWPAAMPIAITLKRVWEG